MPWDTRLNREHVLCLRLADTLWAWIIVGPLCVFYWSGTWKIMDHYVVKDNALASGLISLGIGSTLGFLHYLILPLFQGEIDPHHCSLIHTVISRFLIYLHNFGTLNFWRGIWQVMDKLVGTSWCIAVYIVCGSATILLLLRSISNCMAVPFLVNLDVRHDFYQTYPRFRMHVSNPGKYIADIFFTHFVITHLVVQVWRGVWHIMDAFIWPNNLFSSYMLSLAIGYGAAIVLSALQYPFYLIAKRLHQKHWFLELIFEDIVKIVVILTTLLMWHGGWGLCKDYLLTTEVHFWASHLVGIVGLLLLQVASTVGVVGAAVDCYTGKGSGMIYPIDYFIHFFKLYLDYRSREEGEQDFSAASPLEREQLLSADSVSYSSEEEEHSALHPHIN